MIRRPGNSELLLITQHDHALLAGELASHFGNVRFARPARAKSVLTAVAMHDCGWPLHDERPTLNPHHRPLDVFETPARIGVKVWSASASRAAEVDAYAGLLVSLHVLSLSLLNESKNPHDVFAINKFQHQEIERQESLRRSLGLRTDLPLKFGLAQPGTEVTEDQIAFDLGLLQAMDMASLALCCKQLPAKLLRQVLIRPGGEAVELAFSRVDDQTVIASPWPFDVDEIAAQVPFRVVPDGAFTNDGDLRAALARAPIESLPVTLRGA